MSEWEINQIFKVADFNRDDQIDMNEWRNFRFTFVDKFEKADSSGSLYLTGA